MSAHLPSLTYVFRIEPVSVCVARCEFHELAVVFLVGVQSAIFRPIVIVFSNSGYQGVRVFAGNSRSVSGEFVEAARPLLEVRGASAVSLLVVLVRVFIVDIGLD